MRTFPAGTEVFHGKRTSIPCPLCKAGTLMVRQNSHNAGLFLGCTQYPDCKHTEPFEIESVNQLQLF